MTKSKMRGNKEAAYFREERDVMAMSESPWITTLHFAFQDTQYIYLVMEYNQGGNLLTQLYKDDVFDEPTARFYLAETILSVHAIHELGYLHRDVKPENLMLDPKGHIKITDFGTCIRMNAKGEVTKQQHTIERTGFELTANLIIPTRLLRMRQLEPQNTFPLKCLNPRAKVALFMVWALIGGQLV